MRKKLIQKEIFDFVENYPDRASTKTRWKRPLVAFASAEDRLFPELKKVVRPTHALPQDLLTKAKTVVTYFFPFENKVQEMNAREEEHPAREWAIAYIETNRLIQDLGNHLKDFLERAGYGALSTPATHNYDQAILLSDWSHRHVAYIAGLGRFGLNRWLITEAGCCGRLGSLVTEAFFSPSLRPQGEFCLQFAGQECSACIAKCKYGGLLIDQFDRHACNRQLLKNDAFFSDLATSDVCGKCGCGLPCSDKNPVRGNKFP